MNEKIMKFRKTEMKAFELSSHHFFQPAFNGIHSNLLSGLHTFKTHHFVFLKNIIKNNNF